MSQLSSDTILKHVAHWMHGPYFGKPCSNQLWEVIHSSTIHKANHKNHNEPFLTLDNTEKLYTNLWQWGTVKISQKITQQQTW